MRHPGWSLAIISREGQGGRAVRIAGLTVEHTSVIAERALVGIAQRPEQIRGREAVAG